MMTLTDKARIALEAEDTGHFKRMQKALLVLNRKQGHIYGGTVPAHVIEKRRARNKMARRSRRANRR